MMMMLMDDDCVAEAMTSLLRMPVVPVRLDVETYWHVVYS
jgi:hypothetical protein